MIARQRINQARRMIENQHLAEGMAKTLPRGSAERNRLVLLAVYSNVKANELVATQDSSIHDQNPGFQSI
jgi:hypothetical protein